MTTTDTPAHDTATPAIAFPASVRIHHATLKSAEKLAQMLKAEYPALHLGCTFDDVDAPTKIVAWIVNADQEGEEEQALVYEGDKVPALADLLAECEENEIDPEYVAEPEEEEPEVSGSVVPGHYRQQYRAVSSNGQTCGDWLAEWLVDQTHSATGFMVADFTAILEANDMDLTSKWGQLPGSGQPGWIGRYRMNGRQCLEKMVALRGWVKDAQGYQTTLPTADLAILTSKHTKWLAKQAKLAMAMLTPPEAADE